MKDSDLKKIIELSYVGGGFIPSNEKARELAETCVKGEVITFIEVTARDLKFLRCYMAMIKYVYDYMPKSFKNEVPNHLFYQYLKLRQGRFEIKHIIKNGIPLIEYESISFGNMSQKRFENFVKEQMPVIYLIISEHYSDNFYDNIIENIETEFTRFLEKLR